MGDRYAGLQTVSGFAADLASRHSEPQQSGGLWGFTNSGLRVGRGQSRSQPSNRSGQACGKFDSRITRLRIMTAAWSWCRRPEQNERVKGTCLPP